MEEVIVYFWLVVGTVLCLALHFCLHALVYFWALVMLVYITLLSSHPAHHLHFCLTALACVS